MALLYLLAALHATRERWYLSPDSSETASIARSLLEGEGFTVPHVSIYMGLPEQVRHVPEMHGLLQPLALVPFFVARDWNPQAVRWPAIVYVALTGLVAFFLANHLFGPFAGLLALVLTLCSPKLHKPSVLGLDDCGFAFFFLLTLYLLYRAFTEPSDRRFVFAGVAAGFALLQKLMALFLPALLALPLIGIVQAPLRRRLRWTALASVPFVLALGSYLARNWVAHGGLSFRVSPLEWMWKAAPIGQRWEVFRAIYEPPPTLPEVLATLGRERVLSVVGAEFQRLFAAASPLQSWDEALVAPAFLGVAGVVSLLAHLRRRRAFAFLGLASTLAASVFVCVSYHVEPRYFAFLTPLFAVSLAGAALPGSSGARTARWARAGRAATLAVLLLAVGGNAIATWQWLQHPASPDRYARSGRCGDVVARFIDSTPESERIMGFMPAQLAWSTGREAVAIPSGGPDEILRVARLYGVRWLLVEPFPLRGATRAAIGRLEASAPTGVRVPRAGRACWFLRLDP